MDISLDAAAWRAEEQAGRRFARGLDAQAKARVREAALDGVRQIKILMPVDTGRARAEWGVEEAGGVFEVSADHLSVTQGTTLDYVPRLNEGWSQQAPAGFIDAEGDNMLELLDELLDGDAIREWLSADGGV